MDWEIKIDIRSQSKHDLRGSSVKIGNHLTVSWQQQIWCTFLGLKDENVMWDWTFPPTNHPSQDRLGIFKQNQIISVSLRIIPFLVISPSMGVGVWGCGGAPHMHACMFAQTHIYMANMLKMPISHRKCLFCEQLHYYLQLCEVSLVFIFSLGYLTNWLVFNR